MIAMIKFILFFIYFLSQSGQAQNSNSFSSTDMQHQVDGKYTTERQDLHKEIIGRLLGGGRSAETPFLVVIGGAPGAGKTTVIEQLHQQGLINQEHFLAISADVLKIELPEYSALARADKVNQGTAIASAFTHNESMHLRTLMLKDAFYLRKNILLETTLTDKPAVERNIAQLRQDYPEYGVVFVHVKANLATHLSRVKTRAASTGRYLEERYVKEAYIRSENLFRSLRSIADFSMQIRNENEPYVISTAEGGNTRKWYGLTLRSWAGRGKPLESFYAGRKLVDLMKRPLDYLRSSCKQLLPKAKSVLSQVSHL